MKLAPKELSYDAQNRLSKVVVGGETVTYQYNGDGLLVGKLEKGVQTRYYYDSHQEQIIAEATIENGTPKLVANYIRGNRLEVIKYADDTKAYPVYNGHGDVTELRDETGALLNSYEYDLWGSPTSKQETVHNPFLYAGELWDDTVELQYLRARWYDPSVGRFLNEDTYEGDLDDPLTLNLYTYVVNNPLKYVDPSGHYFKTIGYQELEILLNDAIVKSKSTKNTQYYVHKAFIRDRYDLVGAFGGENQYNYLFDLLTGTSAYGNSKGKSDWARQQILSAYQKWTDAETLATAAGGLISDTNFGGKVSAGSKGGSTKGCNCFAAGTKVQTAAGEKNIEDIEVGDNVLAKDANNSDGELAYKEVTGLFRSQRNDIIKLHVGERIIETTDNHPFWVEDKGWLFADELKAGDRLQKADGSNLKIEKVEFVKLDNPITVYNFTVADYHTYYVTDLGIWVHNTMCAWVPGFKPLGRGSTGRTTPKNDRELKVMQKAMANPGKGEILIMRSGMKDNRWRKEDGWVKMSKEANGVEVHWVYNLKTRQYDDFKFKDR